MDIKELSNLFGKPIVVRYQPNLEQFQAKFEHGEIKKGGLLHGEYGIGATADAAINDYCRRIVGQRIVFNAASPEYRQEYNIPKMLSHTARFFA